MQMAKDSLKITKDISACLYMDQLSQFEAYINTTYIHGMSLIDDLFSELMKKSQPTSYSDSARNITEALVVFKTN